MRSDFSFNQTDSFERVVTYVQSGLAADSTQAT